METEVTRYGFHTESRMRENCTYGSMRGRAYPTTRGAPLYSTPHGNQKQVSPNLGGLTGVRLWAYNMRR